MERRRFRRRPRTVLIAYDDVQDFPVSAASDAKDLRLPTGQIGRVPDHILREPQRAALRSSRGQPPTNAVGARRVRPRRRARRPHVDQTQSVARRRGQPEPRRRQRAARRRGNARRRRVSPSLSRPSGLPQQHSCASRSSPALPRPAAAACEVCVTTLGPRSVMSYRPRSPAPLRSGETRRWNRRLADGQLRRVASPGARCLPGNTDAVLGHRLQPSPTSRFAAPRPTSVAAGSSPSGRISRTSSSISPKKKHRHADGWIGPMTRVDNWREEKSVTVTADRFGRHRVARGDARPV